MTNTDKTLSAFEVTYTVTAKQLGSVAIPAYDKAHAEARLRDMLPDDATLEVTGVYSLDEAPQFKDLIARYQLTAEEQEAALARWMASAEAVVAETLDKGTTDEVSVELPANAAAEKIVH